MCTVNNWAKAVFFSALLCCNKNISIGCFKMQAKMHPCWVAAESSAGMEHLHPPSWHVLLGFGRTTPHPLVSLPVQLHKCKCDPSDSPSAPLPALHYSFSCLPQPSCAGSLQSGWAKKGKGKLHRSKLGVGGGGEEMECSWEIIFKLGPHSIPLLGVAMAELPDRSAPQTLSD